MPGTSTDAAPARPRRPGEAAAAARLQGVGLGLRRPMLAELERRGDRLDVDFLEVAPENWIGVGGRYGRRLRELEARYPFANHGLSLSLGGPGPLDVEFLGRLRRFLDEHGVLLYSEHLSYCTDDGHLYDLMPIPFTEAAVRRVAARIRAVQDALGRRIAVENVSYYAAPAAGMTELEFLNAVLERADCDLLLDVNNVYVNAVNHRYKARAFLAGLPAQRVACLHVAGHYVEAEDLRIDTHGAPVCDPVWDLLGAAYRHCGVRPTVLERDFNLPPLDVLLQEVAVIRRLQTEAATAPAVIAD